MPFPANVQHFLDPHPNPHATWGPFADYCWFHLRGYKEAVVQVQQQAQAAGANVSRDTVKQFRSVATQNVPAQLVNMFPAGQWRDLSSPQIDKANTASPMRFDKACLAAAALDQCAARHAPGLNPLAAVTVCPATYVLDGFDTTRWQGLRNRGQAFVDALKQHTLQRQDNFFTELAKGYSATRLTVALTLNFLQGHNLANGLAIRELNARYDDAALPRAQRRTKNPNTLETVALPPPGHPNP